MHRFSRTLCLALGSLIPVVLTGCSLGPTAAESSSDPGLPIQGMVHGGQQPISGAHVYLLAANTTGNAGPGIAASSSNLSVSLLNPAKTGNSDSIGGYVLTDINGGFTITSDYTCTQNTQVYLYVLGGNPGVGGGANSASGLMAALGNCPSGGSFLSSIPYVIVNEVSTVAAAYAMAGFATDALHVSSSGTAAAKAGLANAFINAAILETLSTGVANPYPPPGVGYYGGPGVVPQAEINTLGNILAACVNSSGLSSSGCTTLFSNAMNGSAQPSDTATAAINIAHNPAANVSALYGLSTSNPPFASALTAQPNDFTISILYQNEVLAGFSNRTAGPLAIDASGDVWSANNVVDEINPQGYDTTVASSQYGLGGYSGFSGAANIAIDVNGNAWAISSSALGEFNNSGGLVSPSGGYTGLGLNAPKFIAMDASSNAWIGNAGDASVVKGVELRRALRHIHRQRYLAAQAGGHRHHWQRLGRRPQQRRDRQTVAHRHPHQLHGSYSKHADRHCHRPQWQCLGVEQQQRGRDLQ